MGLVGKRFGKLVVLGELAFNPSFGRYSGKRLLVKCDCGNIKNANMRSVVRGRTKSCGCLHRDVTATHGISGKRLYNIYRGMLIRCYSKGHWLYPRYGGRGIYVCDDWKNDILKFYNWAKENGYKKYLTIDRINNDGPYEPSNCRFVTLKQNLNNTSKTIYLNIFGEKIPLQYASEIYNINPEVIYQRVKKLKWFHEKAAMQPVRAMKARLKKI